MHIQRQRHLNTDRSTAAADRFQLKIQSDISINWHNIYISCMLVPRQIHQRTHAHISSSHLPNHIALLFSFLFIYQVFIRLFVIMCSLLFLVSYIYSSFSSPASLFFEFHFTQRSVGSFFWLLLERRMCSWRNRKATKGKSEQNKTKRWFVYNDTAIADVDKFDFRILLIFSLSFFLSSFFCRFILF